MLLNIHSPNSDCAGDISHHHFNEYAFILMEEVVSPETPLPEADLSCSQSKFQEAVSLGAHDRSFGTADDPVILKILPVNALKD